MSLFAINPEGIKFFGNIRVEPKTLRAPSFRLFSGERVGSLSPQSALFLGSDQ
jgi:hypothetical protein